MCLVQRMKTQMLWFDYFLFSFSLEIENGDGNVFDWIFENMFSKNIFSNEPKNGNNKIRFSFTENVFKNPTKHISITIFYFQWKWKQKTVKPNTPLYDKYVPMLAIKDGHVDNHFSDKFVPLCHVAYFINDDRRKLTTI